VAKNEKSIFEWFAATFFIVMGRFYADVMCALWSFNFAILMKNIFIF